MTVKERILALRLLEKQKKNLDFIYKDFINNETSDASEYEKHIASLQQQIIIRISKMEKEFEEFSKDPTTSNIKNFFPDLNKFIFYHK